MRRILVVDDDLHTRLAIRTWLQRCGFRVAIADGGPTGLAALDDATFDLMIVDIFMPNMRGFESIRVFHQRAPTVPLIAIFRLRLFRPGNRKSRLPQNGARPRCDEVPAQALQTGDVAQRDRRMPVGSRAASKICRNTGRRHDRAVGTARYNGAAGYFEGEDGYGLSRQQDVIPAFKGIDRWWPNRAERWRLCGLSRLEIFATRPGRRQGWRCNRRTLGCRDRFGADTARCSRPS